MMIPIILFLTRVIPDVHYHYVVLFISNSSTNDTAGTLWYALAKAIFVEDGAIVFDNWQHRQTLES